MSRRIRKDTVARFVCEGIILHCGGDKADTGDGVRADDGVVGGGCHGNEHYQLSLLCSLYRIMLMC